MIDNYFLNLGIDGIDEGRITQYLADDVAPGKYFVHAGEKQFIVDVDNNMNKVIVQRIA
jgi:hypothetical protein